jgi:hypothetical protein
MQCDMFNESSIDETGNWRKGGDAALKPAVKASGRDALNGVWERLRKLRQKPPFSTTFPRIGSYCWFRMQMFEKYNRCYDAGRAPAVGWLHSYWETRHSPCSPCCFGDTVQRTSSSLQGPAARAIVKLPDGRGVLRRTRQRYEKRCIFPGETGILSSFKLLNTEVSLQSYRFR